MRFFFFLSVVLLLASCHSTKTAEISTTPVAKPATEHTKDLVIGKVEIQHFSDYAADTTIHTLSYMYYDATIGPKAVYKDSINQHIIDFTRTSTEFEIDESKTATLNNEFFEAQLKLFEAIAAEEYSLDETANLWDYQGNIAITEYPDFVTLEMGNWTYTGGAHGNGFTGYTMIDRKTGAVLHLADFVTDLSAFAVIAEREFRKDNEIGENDNLLDLGFWFEEGKFQCNENFYFDSNELVFFYNNYEIAPYSAGQITFSISLSDLTNLLRIKP